MLNLIGVIIAFIFILVLIRKKIPFGIALIFGSLLIGLFSLEIITPIDIPKTMIQASFYSFETHQIDTEPLELAVLMTLIFMLAKSMQHSGAISKLIDSLRTFFSRGGLLGIIPAVYGLMPVPGGALFSAPLIDKEGEKFSLNQDKKNFLNVWFRHVWFPIYPISQAMILICSVKFSNIAIESLILINIPAFAVFVIIGFMFLRRYIGVIPKTNNPQPKQYQGLVFLLPPIIPLFFYFLKIFGFTETRCFLIGLMVSLLILFFLLKINGKQYVEYLKKSVTWTLALAIFGILILREMISVSQTPELIAHMMQNFAFPALIIVIFIPILLGVITGYNLGAVALSYPLIEPFFEFTNIHIIGLTSIIFMSSLLGYLISPIHLCNVVSSEYLHTDTTRMYKMYIPAVGAVIIFHIVIVLLFYSL